MRRLFAHPLLLSALPLLLSSLGGCAGDARLRGEWSGDCLLETVDGPRRLPFELAIDAQRQGVFSGTGAFEYDGYTFQGDVDGTVDGAQVIFDLVGIYGGYTVTMAADAELEDNGDVEGDCSFFELTGDLDMDQ